jgi:predicted RNase H-like nuclease (RuvC/YqgF family)
VSRPPDPDDPTRRLPPASRPPRTYEREVAVTAGDDLVWREELLDRLSSLRAAVVMIGIVAVAALGIALWALLTQEEESDAQRGASVERVRALEERVEELEQDVEGAATGDAVSQLSENVESLDDRVGALEDRSEGGASAQAVEDLQGDVQELGDAVEELGDAVEQLDRRVDAVEQQQEASP